MGDNSKGKRKSVCSGVTYYWNVQQDAEDYGRINLNIVSEDRLSGTKAKAWSFGTGGNMMFTGSVVCIYDSFGKPEIDRIIFSKNKKEAQVYVRTDSSIKNQERVVVILDNVSTVQVFDSETESSFDIYPDAFRD
ncbi:hypothetical protein PALU110988_28175 [Paenibacillus lupini]|uniref:hypothetical protein n=1 Tax=Paenibacillus lupini TaxID=1450204 RepID=UPI001422CCCA|nr:hypothetical protein [Paenibacillus lupini]NIK21576.1 hypothetical protein [Paenibacillus lupini]